MARTKITRDSVTAFYEWKRFKRSNTEVVVWASLTNFYLFWNRIAIHDRQLWILYINHCWRTTFTTKERLNWILRKFKAWYIRQKNYLWYYISENWNEQLFNNNRTIEIDLNKYVDFTFIKL